MKNMLLLSTLVLLFAGQVQAATPTATRSASTPTPTNKIDDLKERLATKVAELRQTQPKAMYGTVKAVSLSTFTVETDTRELKIELTDDISVFQTIKGKRTKLTIEDIEKDDIVTVFGQYDTGLDLLRAKVVVIQSTPVTRIWGTVSAIDRKDYTVTVTTSAGEDYVIDIEKTTTALLFDPAKGLIKGGFSKLIEGNTIHVVGTSVAQVDRRIRAVRLVDLGNLSGITPTPTELVSPAASGSATATATPKPTGKLSPTPTLKP